MTTLKELISRGKRFPPWMEEQQVLAGETDGFPAALAAGRQFLY